MKVEARYSLSHAYGAVQEIDLIAACVVGDGEAETGPLRTQANKIINPINDGGATYLAFEWI